jgi:HPt (histidine-containing phosphotransfer) domain-containing protein
VRVRTELPVLDPRALRRLGNELHDHSVARSVAQRFVELLPDRTRTLSRALRLRDLDSALEVALSLKVTSATIGGCRMQAVASDVEQSLRRGSWGRARRAASQLRQETTPLRRSLSALIGR